MASPGSAGKSNEYDELRQSCRTFIRGFDGLREF